jgi:glutathionylspermidine synthase
MKNVLVGGPRLDARAWQRLRTRAIFDYCKWDPQCEDHSVLADFPLLLTAREFAKIGGLAECLSAEALAAEREILTRPELLENLAIPVAIQKALRRGAASYENELRVMRFDFHYTTVGWRISEVNADVPGGYVEASGWNRLFAAEYQGTSAPPDASEGYVEAIRRVAGDSGVVALVHATVYSEDRQIMAHLARVMKGRGLKPVLAGARNIAWEGGRAQWTGQFECGEPTAVVRLYPAEWLPSSGGDGDWTGWFSDGVTPMSNPGCAIVLQSKRFALVWDRLNCELATWRQLLPPVVSPSEVRDADLNGWVLKPAFGRVGEDVGIRGVSPGDEYRAILRSVGKRPTEWVAQRRFEIVPVETEAGPKYPCIGVYTVGGKVAGLYGRVSSSPLIDGDAQDAAVLLAGRGEEGLA